MSLHKPAMQLVTEAEARIRTVDIREARSLLGQPDHLFVDLRDIRELTREGRIPGSLHAPRGMLEFWVDPESPYHREVFAEAKTFVFYCQSGWRSALATAAVQDMGLPSVCHIGGGYAAWCEAGGPTEAVEPRKPRTRGDTS